MRPNNNYNLVVFKADIFTQRLNIFEMLVKRYEVRSLTLIVVEMRPERRGVWGGRIATNSR